MISYMLIFVCRVDSCWIVSLYSVLSPVTMVEYLNCEGLIVVYSVYYTDKRIQSLAYELPVLGHIRNLRLTLQKKNLTQCSTYMIV